MDSQRRARSSAFEYFLYSAILVETALAAFVYKEFHNSELTRWTLYLAIFYIAFLVWAVMQLNKLHRNRSSAPEPELVEPPSADPRRVFGLTITQFLIVLVFFAAAVVTFSWGLRVLR